LLAQTLAASTYPLELIQLQQWLLKNPVLKDQALADAVAKQPWDPSIQALAGLPDVVKRLADDIQWTTDLGNAFLAQQGDVMDAVQRMREKAQDNGNLKSGEQQRVETKVIEHKSVIVIEQSNPQVVYVPSYDPLVVWGAPLYPYPPIYYPPAGYYVAGLAISFGVGMMMGAFWSGGWGCGRGWGNNNININNNNNFNRNSNIGGNRPILGVETAHRNNPVAVALVQAVETPVGGTIRNIAAGRHIATVRPQTGLAAQREATRLLTVRLVPGNSLAVRAAIWQAIGPATDGQATGLAEDWAQVTGSAEGGQIALEAGTSRAAAQATEMHSEEVPGVLRDTTDPARARTAAAVPPAWDPEVEASAAAVDLAAVAGGGKRRSL
jgi:hypothetical protein